MVARKVMDINREAQEYLKQFTTPRNRTTANHDDSARESMFDTWTREKYRGKSSGKKSSSHLPKEWSKVSSAYSGTHTADNEMDDLLNVACLTTEQQQDTYMNEEAFLEQLLQEDTKPHKSLKSRPSKVKGSPNSSKPSINGVHHSHKTVASVHAVSKSMDTSGLVQGQHTSNQSRRAVLRHVNPDIHHAASPESNKLPHQELLHDTASFPKKVGNPLKPSIHLMPVCQKCGWNLTPTQTDLPLQSDPGHHMDHSKAVDSVDKTYEEHSKLVDRSTNHVYSTLNRETVARAQNGSGVGPYSSHGLIQHAVQSHSSTDSAQEMSASYCLSPRQRTSLTTSRLCHHKASQTDAALLGKEPSSSGESGKPPPPSGGVEHTKAHTRAKPPSGRPPRADSTPGSADTGEVTPVLEAVKSGNLNRLKEVLESDAELSKIHNVQGNNLLHMACERGHMTCVQHLASDYPHLVDEENKAKFSPAALTIKSGHPEILDWLIENTQAKEEMAATAHRKSLLHHAAKFGQDGCLRIVLEKLSALDRHNACCDSNGNSPAHVAAKHGHLLCLQTLLEYNMDVTKANRYGHSPCYYADFSNHRLCAGYLMVVETCLNLAKKLIRLERSMEQLSSSLAKYSHYNPGELAISVDLNVDRSSGTSSVEDDGTRDDAWQLLCRKFEEASKRLVVFRTQNRAMRPLRPTKLALLALAQTKEEAQAALSVFQQTKKPSSTTKSLDGDNRVTGEIKWDDGRSRSFPDLTSSLDNTGKQTINKVRDLPQIKGNSDNVHTAAQETIIFQGDDDQNKAFSVQHFPTNSKGEPFQVKLDLDQHSNKSETSRHLATPEMTPDDLDISRVSPGKVVYQRKAHRRSSSVGDIIESERPVHDGDISYHLKTRVMPPSPTINSVPNSPPPLPPRRKTTSQIDQWALPPRTLDLGSHLVSTPGPSNLTEQNVKAIERQFPQHQPQFWESELEKHRQRHVNNHGMADNFESETDDNNTRGAAAAFQYDRNAPHRRLYNRSKRQPREPHRPLGENEQTSDFFEDSTGKHDSDASELNAETLKKILDMQEEILRCHPGHLHDPPGTRIRTPVKLQLTTEDFKETYARKEQEGEELEDEVSSPFRLRRAQWRTRHGDNMNKSGNNSYIEGAEEAGQTWRIQEQTPGEQEEFSRSQCEADTRPWYEMTDDENTEETDRQKEEYFTVL